MNVFGAKGFALPQNSLEDDIREKVKSLPARTPDAPPPSLDNISDLVGRGIAALTEEHQEMLDRARFLFLQVESCLESARAAREQMLTARKGALCERPVDEVINHEPERETIPRGDETPGK